MTVIPFGFSFSILDIEGGAGGGGTPPPTRLISWEQLVLENDPTFQRDRLQPWIYQFSNNRLFYSPVAPYAPLPDSGLANDGGFLFADGSISDLPTTDPLRAGSVFSNGGFLCTSAVTTYQPGLSIFYPCTLDQILLVGAAAWPTSQPVSGSSQIWNNGGFACVA